ncbi:MAG: RnfABCDGE type electron transport complex subunit D [Chitinispirillaceae bacterium]|nr:RnfABCDGE type electron transport complex subunit D [Chitinispirillaceae bacterium]
MSENKDNTKEAQNIALVNGKEAEERVELHLSSSPHIRASDSVASIMKWVVSALTLPFVAGIVFFGIKAFMVTAVSVITAVLTEWIVCKIQKKPSTIGDFSAVVTGILLAFNVPPDLPLWMVALGSVFAIGVAKMAFGGLGANFINPALAGRAFLMASYPSEMTHFCAPIFGSISGLKNVTAGSQSVIDAVSSATPLALFKTAIHDKSFIPLDFQDAIGNLFMGNVGGCIGETSAFAILIGGLLLVYKRIIPLRIPVIYIGTVFILSWIFNGTGSYFTSSAIVIPFYQIFAGGLFLGAFFMATDMVTIPITPKGKIVFAFGCGLLTFLIRKFGGYPEGVSYSILIMNLFVPLIERYTRPKIYGGVKKRV